jgi:hypothetical protein
MNRVVGRLAQGRTAIGTLLRLLGPGERAAAQLEAPRGFHDLMPHRPRQSPTISVAAWRPRA